MFPADSETLHRPIRWRARAPVLNTQPFLTERASCLCGDEGKIDRTVWKINNRKEGGNQRSKGQVLYSRPGSHCPISGSRSTISRGVIVVVIPCLGFMTVGMAPFFRYCKKRDLQKNQ
jgi:hypothetical protein